MQVIVEKWSMCTGKMLELEEGGRGGDGVTWLRAAELMMT